MNKKGLADPITAYFATLAIVLILIIFFVLLSIHSNQKTVRLNEEKAYADGHLFLVAYLNTPFGDETVAKHIEKQGLTESLEQWTYLYIDQVMEATGCPVKITISIDDEHESYDRDISAEEPCVQNGRFLDDSQSLPSNKTILVSLIGGSR